MKKSNNNKILKNLFKYFVKHPKEIGETYFQHFWFSFKQGFVLILAGIVSIVHSIFPFAFKHCVSTMVCSSNEKMQSRKTKKK